MIIWAIYDNSPKMKNKLNETLKDGYVFEDGRVYLVEQDAGQSYINSDNDQITKENNNIIKPFKFDDFTPIYMECILQRADAGNRNGRIYPKRILEREFQRYFEVLNDGRAFGEEDHPDSSTISLEKVCQRVVDMWWRGNEWMGKLEIITSPGYHKLGIVSLPGDRIAEYLRRNAKIGISSRGVGSLKNEGKFKIVQDDFEMIGFDLVHSPSTYGSYLYKVGSFTDKKINNEQEEKVNNDTDEEKKSNLLEKIEKFCSKKVI